MRIYCCLAVGWLLIHSASAQITYTAAFTHALEKAGIGYAEPGEQWLHVTLPPEHEFMEYDLVLQNDRNDLEFRYRIQSGRYAESDIPASVIVSSLVASIATNQDPLDIHIQIPTDHFLKEAFNADRGVIAYFTPKAEFSEKPYGAYLSLYANGRSGIDIVILYADETFDPLTMYRGVYFTELSGQK